MTLRRRRSSTRPRFFASLVLAFICGSISGCTTTETKTIPLVGPTRQWEARELVDALAQRAQQFRSMRALARVDYSGPEGKHNFQEAILVQRPDRLRLETLSFLGAILIVTVDNQEIVAYQPREGVMVRGRRSKDNLARFTQIPLDLPEITAALMGLPPVDANAPSTQEGNALVFFASGGMRDRVSFESAQPMPTQWQRINGAGDVELTASFSDYIQTTVGPFASRIQIEAPLQKKRVEIRMQEPELNGSLSADLFQQQKTAGVKEYAIEALGGQQ